MKRYEPYIAKVERCFNEDAWIVACEQEMPPENIESLKVRNWHILFNMLPKGKIVSRQVKVYGEEKETKQ